MEDIVPTEIQLSQNYPNPFKARTTIKYCVPDKMKIMLEVFNSNNRKVKTLINEVKEAGTYKVELSRQMRIPACRQARCLRRKCLELTKL